MLTGNSEDPFFEKGHYEKLFSEFEAESKKCRHIIYDQAGHPAMMSNLEDFIKATKAFLGGKE